MTRQAHDTDGAEFGPASRAAWTVGTLKAAIAGIPDDALLVVNAPDFTDPDFVVEQVVVGAGLADGRDSRQGIAFELNCEAPEGLIEVRAGRARALPAHEPLVGQTQCGPSREPTPRLDRELEAEP